MIGSFRHQNQAVTRPAFPSTLGTKWLFVQTMLYIIVCFLFGKRTVDRCRREKCRMGTVDEVVEAVLYQESDGFVTGETVHIDGGAHAGKW